MLTFTARLTVKEGHESDFFSLMRRSLPAIRGEAGCLAFFFHRVPEHPRQFFFYEQWKDKEALAEHNAHLKELGVNLGEIKEAMSVEYLDLIAE